MLIRQVVPGIYQALLPAFKSNFSDLNLYIVRSAGSSLIIDTGYANQYYYDCLQEIITTLKLNPKKTEVFITHSHVDHNGGAKYLSDLGMKIYMNAAETGFVSPFQEFKDDFPAVLQKVAVLGINENLAKHLYDLNFPQNPNTDIAIPPAYPYQTVCDGEIMTVGDYDFKIIPLPGHTNAQQGLYDPISEILLSGDQIISGIVPLVATWYPDEGILQKYLDSLNYVQDLNPKMLLTGHGDNIYNVAERVQEIRASYLVKCKSLQTIIKQAGDWLNVCEIALTAYHMQEDAIQGIVARTFFMMVSKTFSCLEYLYGLGVLQRKEVGGTLYYSLVKN